MSDPVRPFRPALLIASGAAAVVLAAWAVEARIESASTKAANAAVSAKWDEVYQARALQACTTAADQGAYRAVSEAMSQTVLPMQREIDKHMAGQVEHEKRDDTRFRRIERRLGISGD